MKTVDIGKQRLISQQATGKAKNISKLVAHMGAVQAQDPLMAMWALGLRVSGSKHEDVVEAINRGEIIRTHVLRATWHFVAAKNVHWMLELSAKRIQEIASFRDKELGLDAAIFKKSNRLMEKAFSGKNTITREELVALLNKNKIRTNENRASHILLRAETEGLICSGELVNERHAYALLDERVKRKQKLNREEALAQLAKIYFNSHGPATLADFTWWSGLVNGEAKKALESVKGDLRLEKIEGSEYWMSSETTGPRITSAKIFILPAYDEFLIAYKDRSAVMDKVHNKRVLMVNGIFRPVVVQNGQISGTWKRTIAKDHLKLDVQLFGKSSPETEKHIRSAASRLASFYGMKVVVA